MNNLKDILLEKLKVSTTNTPSQDMDYIDNLPLGEEKK